jgi:hypothetical protein
MRPLPLWWKSTGKTKPFLFSSKILYMTIPEKFAIETKNSTTDRTRDCERRCEMKRDQYKVSEQTARHVDCADGLNELYGSIYDALMEMYGDEETVESMLREKFEECYIELKDEIMRFAFLSIKDKMWLCDSTEI